MVEVLDVKVEEVWAEAKDVDEELEALSEENGQGGKALRVGRARKNRAEAPVAGVSAQKDGMLKLR